MIKLKLKKILFALILNKFKKGKYFALTKIFASAEVYQIIREDPLFNKKIPFIALLFSNENFFFKYLNLIYKKDLIYYFDESEDICLLYIYQNECLKQDIFYKEGIGIKEEYKWKKKFEFEKFQAFCNSNQNLNLFENDETNFTYDFQDLDYDQNFEFIIEKIKHTKQLNREIKKLTKEMLYLLFERSSNLENLKDLLES